MVVQPARVDRDRNSATIFMSLSVGEWGIDGIGSVGTTNPGVRRKLQESIQPSIHEETKRPLGNPLMKNGIWHD
jgi:hypothetical protein